MSAADWLSYAPQGLANAATFFALLLTLISAYLVTAYFVGKELTRSQVTLVNFVFIASSISLTFGQGVALRNAILAFHYGSLKVDEIPVFPAYLITSVPIFITTIDLIFTLGCLKFMWDVRHPKKE
jgi:hypothetical protein